jgi:hypothetical protein
VRHPEDEAHLRNSLRDKLRQLFLGSNGELLGDALDTCRLGFDGIELKPQEFLVGDAIDPGDNPFKRLYVRI